MMHLFNKGYAVQFPSENDVLSGRGGKINDHYGNRQFRAIVKEFKERYNLTDKKNSKASIAREVVGQITALGGRFLRKDPASGYWIDEDESNAMKKTSQALRENAPKIRARVLREIRDKKLREDPTMLSSSFLYPSNSDAEVVDYINQQITATQHNTNSSVMTLPSQQMMQQSGSFSARQQQDNQRQQPRRMSSRLMQQRRRSSSIQFADFDKILGSELFPNEQQVMRLSSTRGSFKSLGGSRRSSRLFQRAHSLALSDLDPYEGLDRLLDNPFEDEFEETENGLVEL
mmetsp:Transcript_10271/g.15292  ORF Transcript_10271/g.15292 Transcript_10271/m.15292 type:complete len:288 (-) Transcript_10271:96-959(-)|eukprot:CAMPEP_0196810766 /NCGR_PEP_ID=MMETSP1362-20130617/13759_1 /TAXON_ID=163516 /ORGANISM="Leptocylindrus danicus, Strain CCMP1856" /LENGTH=287 /DNA_ID=CAMNT_0042185897 /DNA_START=65 /DNA_END=928 /DNA_ORIENTATION=-